MLQIESIFILCLPSASSSGFDPKGSCQLLGLSHCPLTLLVDVDPLSAHDTLFISACLSLELGNFILGQFPV
jgi:hypothetical protein